MKITEIISPKDMKDATIAGTTPQGGVIIKTNNGTEVTIDDPDMFYKDPRDGTVHMKAKDPNQANQPQIKKPAASQQLNKLRPGDKIITDPSQGRSF